MLRWLTVCTALLLTSVAYAYGDAAGQRRLKVEWQQGRLSVRANAVPLPEILATVAGKTGVEMLGLASLAGTASVSFADLPLRDGLRALLSHINHAVTEEASADGAGVRMLVFVVGHRSRSDAATAAESKDNRGLDASGLLMGHAPDTYQTIERLAEQGDVQGLRASAAQGDPAARALAMQRLARQSPGEARGAASEAAASEDPAQRALAVHVLGGLDSLEATNALGTALTDPDPAVRHAVVVGLMGQSSSAATQLLLQALQDDGESIRLLALDLLAQRGAAGQSGVRSLVNDRDPAVRERARQLLERTGAAD